MYAALGIMVGHKGLYLTVRSGLRKFKLGSFHNIQLLQSLIHGPAASYVKWWGIVVRYRQHRGPKTPNPKPKVQNVKSFRVLPKPPNPKSQNARGGGFSSPPEGPQPHEQIRTMLVLHIMT